MERLREVKTPFAVVFFMFYFLSHYPLAGVDAIPFRSYSPLFSPLEDLSCGDFPFSPSFAVFFFLMA